jgi:YVTN family beta-propeller protein
MMISRVGVPVVKSCGVMMKPLALVALLGCALIASVTAADTIYLALLKGGNALAYLSPDGKVLASVPVGQHPHEMVFSKDRKYLYTADNGIMRIEHAGKGGNSLSIIEVAARKKVGDIPLGDYYRPHGIDLSPETGMLAVTTEGPDQLLLVDPVKRRVMKHFDTKGKTPHMVTFGPGGKWSYVSNSSSGNVSAINVETGETKLILTGERPEGSVLSKDGKELYVVNREADSITVIDTSKQQAIASIQTGKGPVRIALTPDGKTLVYALMHEKKVAFADPGQRKQTGYVIVPGEPISCTLSHDGKLAFVSAETSDTIYVIDLAARKITGEIKLPKDSGPDPVLDIPAR